jgi:hypothetical protein
MRTELITVEQIEDGGPGTLRPRMTMFVAHGADGHTWLLKRTTAEAAARDGLAYFLKTRVQHEGRWYISDEHGKPFADARGERFVTEQVSP